jgi:hypothetical protein
MQGQETKKEVNKGGRPTKYTPEFLELAKDYLQNFNTDRYNDTIPSIAGLAYVANVARQTLHDWYGQEGKEEFSDILDKLLALQEKLTLNGGLNGTYNSAMAKLLLGKHGYSDKTENEHKGEIKTGLQDSDREILNRFLAQQTKT